ncbi:hypothetical protein OF83DRAFT_1173773 [Amylostereum chailletii]|nr:hypothetical protein OF83DRAFT_1173773 [Amylostereum chailletii]
MLLSLQRSSILTLWLFSSNTLAAVVSTNLNIVNKVIAPDGYARDTVLAGGTFPGPIIKGNKGDNFRINVKDSLNDTNMDIVTSVVRHF